MGEPTQFEMTYRIVVHGEFGDLLRAAFSDMSITTGEGKTVLFGRMRDHAELYGVLDRMRDLGIDVLAMGEVEDHP